MVQTSAPDAHPLIPSRGLIVQQGAPLEPGCRHRLVPPAPSRLLERCRSRRSLQQKAKGNGHGRSKGGPVLLSGQLQPAGPVVLPPGSPPASRSPSPVLLPGKGTAGKQTCRNSPSTGTQCPWRPNAAPCSALQGHRLGPSEAPLPHTPSAPASSGQGHLQKSTSP